MAVCGCGGVLDPAGPIGASERTILLNSLGIMLAIVVPTILTTLAVAFWFREGNRRATYRPTWEYSGKVEMVVWAIPMMTVLLLASLCWVGAHELDPPRPLPGKAVQVEVVALDWKWLFIYPTYGIASVNRLVMPVGQPVRFSITSATVMNSFFIPQLGSQIYAMGGMMTHLNLEASRAGTYEGRSAQFSGDGFPGMHFVVEAVPQAGFDGFVAAARRSGQALDAVAYGMLARESANVSPVTFRDVMPHLFEAVVYEQAPAAQATPSSGAVEHTTDAKAAAPAGHDTGARSPGPK